jgi:hypothetical protein
MKTLKSLQERKENIKYELNTLKRKNKVHLMGDEYFRVSFLERALDNVNININQLKQKAMNN